VVKNLRRKKMRNLKILVVFFLTLSLLFGCAKEEKPSKKKQKVIGVSLLTQEHTFYQDLEKGLRESAKKKGFKLIVQSGDFDLATQTNQIENFVVQKVDAIIVSPVDSEGIGAAILRANEKNIPVFTADISAKEGEVISHIASNNYEGGKKAAKYLANILEGKGEVIIINHPEVTSVQERVKGFEDEIKNYPGIKIVDKPSSEGQRAKAMQVMENMLQAHPKLSGVFAINDSSALGALAAIVSSKNKKTVVIGYDAEPEARKEILKGGHLKADVIQYPKEIGKITIETIAKYFKGKEVPKKIPFKVGIVDKEFLEKEKK
jgi:ribose transport system substrate-binding protein